MKTFFEIASNSDFSVYNLPYGIFKPNSGENPRVGVAIGDYILDLSVLDEVGYFNKTALEGRRVFQQSALNPFMKLGRSCWKDTRALIQNVLTNDSLLKDNEKLRNAALIKRSQAELLLPVEIGDYTDFYSSYHHAFNVGTMLRGADNALMPNWKHIPVAYHGRASSVVISGTDFHRPYGQIKLSDGNEPVFSPTRSLDFELEMGFLIGAENQQGTPIPIEKTEDFIFGMVLVNDWSARDIQTWEYQPLGPFLAKNFCTSISPWVITMEALEHFKQALPKQDPCPLPYLLRKNDWTYDLKLEVTLEGEGITPAQTITQSNFKNLYWSVNQQLAHHAINGCRMRVGDLLASGTISGEEPLSRGCLLERTWRGSQPLSFQNGVTRRFLEDGDRVTMRAWNEHKGVRIGFGEVTGKVLPAIHLQTKE